MAAEKGEVMMETMRRSFRLEGMSWRKVGRSNSSLLASELVGSEIAKLAAYERLSESTRVTVNDYSGGNSSSQRRDKVRGWSSLLKAISFRKRVRGEEDVGRGQVVEDDAVKPPAVVVVLAEKKKRKSVWLPSPYRRWPVQGW